MTPTSHEQFQRLMDEMLVAGKAAPEAPQLREHLQTCPACRDYLDTSLRAIAALNSLSFPVDHALPARINAALERRARQLGRQRVPWRRAALASAAALVLTLAGAAVDLRLGGLLALVLEVRRAEIQQALLTFWIGPSLCLLLLFPLLPLLGRRTEGAR